MPTSSQPQRVQLDKKPHKKPPTSKTGRGALLWSILKRLSAFARPDRGLIALTLILTVLGSFTAQVCNAFVLQYTIDSLTNIVDLPDPWAEGIKYLLSRLSVRYYWSKKYSTSSLLLVSAIFVSVFELTFYRASSSQKVVDRVLILQDGVLYQ